jgi:hypothetical protein
VLEDGPNEYAAWLYRAGAHWLVSALQQQVTMLAS